MNETVGVLLVAAVLSAAAVGALAWRLVREDPASPDRLVGELRLSRWVAVLLSALGAMTSGLAAASASAPLANVDAAFGLLLVGLAGLILQREPSDGLLVAAIGFAVYALWSIAHRPGWLPAESTLAWYRAGTAAYGVCLGAISFWVRRR